MFAYRTVRTNHTVRSRISDLPIQYGTVPGTYIEDLTNSDTWYSTVFLRYRIISIILVFSLSEYLYYVMKTKLSLLILSIVSFQLTLGFSPYRLDIRGGNINSSLPMSSSTVTNEEVKVGDKLPSITLQEGQVCSTLPMFAVKSAT